MAVNSPTITYPFTNEDNYSFDSDKIEVDNVAKLKVQSGNLSFNEDFADDTGFTYDSDEIEFSGGLMRQKDNRPANSTFHANYSSNINGTWGSGDLTGTGTGSPVITNGKLDLSGSINKFVDYDGTSNINITQKGCIRFNFTPKYSGLPSTDKILFTACRANGDTDNLIRLRHLATGSIDVRMHDDSGTSIFSIVLGAWTQTIDQEYEFELNIDLDSGATRLFIDGVQHGSTIGNTGTHSNPGLFRLGQDFNNANLRPINGLFDNFILFSDVQHTSDYTPGETILENIYPTGKARLPLMTHAQLLDMISYSSLSTTEVGTVRYTVKTGSGNRKYWNGSAWVDSDDTFSQANTASDISSNLSSLDDADGETTVEITAYFTGATTVSSVSDLTFNYVGHTTYPTDNPNIKTKNLIQATELCSLSLTGSETGADEIKLTLLVDDSRMYWNGSAWASSSGYAQSNTAQEINDNASALSVTQTIQPEIWLHSDDGLTTPEIDELAVGVNYNAPDIESNIEKVTVVGYLYKPSGKPDVGSSVKAQISNTSADYKDQNTKLGNMTIEATTDSKGSWELDLIPSAKIGDAKYTFTFNPKSGKAFVEEKTVKQASPITGLIDYEDLS